MTCTETPSWEAGIPHPVTRCQCPSMWSPSTPVLVSSGRHRKDRTGSRMEQNRKTGRAAARHPERQRKVLHPMSKGLFSLLSWKRIPLSWQRRPVSKGSSNNTVWEARTQESRVNLCQGAKPFLLWQPWRPRSQPSEEYDMKGQGWVVMLKDRTWNIHSSEQSPETFISEKMSILIHMGQLMEQPGRQAFS